MSNEITHSGAGKDSNRVTETLRVTGMTCGGCVRHATRVLQEAGFTVESAQIGQVTISYPPDVTGRERAVDAVADAGYRVE